MWWTGHWQTSHLLQVICAECLGATAHMQILYFILYIYIYVCVCVCVCAYIYMYIY